MEGDLHVDERSLKSFARKISQGSIVGSGKPGKILLPVACNDQAIIYIVNPSNF